MAIQHFLIFAYVFTASTCAATIEPIRRSGQTLAYSPSETTDFSTTHISTDTSFIYLRKEVTVLYQDSECRHMATDFVYRKNFCLGARDPESYLQVARSRYNCLNLCGEAPKFGSETPECGCDAICGLFGDCCKDMAEICPELYSIGQAEYSTLPKNMRRECGCDAICGLFGDCCKDMAEICPELYSIGQAEYSTLPKNMRRECVSYSMFYKQYKEKFSFSVKYVPFTPSIVNKNKVLPFKPRNLAEFTNSLSKYSVVDINTKLDFNNFATFKAYKSTDVSAYFIPKVAGLTCSPVNSSGTAQYPSALQTLPLCRVVKVEDVVTPYHRPCENHQILNCRCEDGNFLKDHVHNVCLGENNYQRGLYRFPLWDMQAKFANDLPPQNKKCIRRGVSAYGIVRP
ncbi:hypothetical protein RRG08_036621 [Elysia crispata]|uniref:SMB domain-containing protein n=1 Tax=Elysia crispata TaxID=231223 RepID=A0AAE1A2K7_9GAST|nr:hypothetical protein RRG08_036621 [Elysia crispata]